MSDFSAAAIVFDSCFPSQRGIVQSETSFVDRSLQGRLPRFFHGSERDTILWSEFWFASLGSWVPCALLVLLSDMMLQVPMMVIAVHQLTCVLLCLGLASIAVGFGAMMPNFREKSPSKIAAGFGGTLNLVLSALYIMVVVVLTALGHSLNTLVIAGLVVGVAGHLVRGPVGQRCVQPADQIAQLVLIDRVGQSLDVLTHRARAEDQRHQHDLHEMAV